MRLWWVSMSLFMELAGEQGKVVTSCSTGRSDWREVQGRWWPLALLLPPPALGRETWWTRWSGPSRPPSSYRWRKCSQCQSGLTGSQGDPPVPGMLYPSLVRMLLLLWLFICSLAKAVSDVNDAMML